MTDDRKQDLIDADPEPQTEPTDAMVSALARSNFEFQQGGTYPSWDTRAEWLKDAYREEARAGLRAALCAAAETTNHENGSKP